MLHRAHFALEATLFLLLLADSQVQRFFAAAIPPALFVLWVILDGHAERRAAEARENPPPRPQENRP